MTPTQCRMARAALGWSTTHLARAANIGPATINRFETGQDARISTVERLRSALEAAGVVFIAERGGGAAVRLRGANQTKQPGAWAGPRHYVGLDASIESLRSSS